MERAALAGYGVECSKQKDTESGGGKKAREGANKETRGVGERRKKMEGKGSHEESVGHNPENRYYNDIEALPCPGP